MRKEISDDEVDLSMNLYLFLSRDRRRESFSLTRTEILIHVMNISRVNEKTARDRASSTRDMKAESNRKNERLRRMSEIKSDEMMR